MIYGEDVNVEFDVENLTFVNLTVFDVNGDPVFSVVSDSSPVSLPVLAAGHYNVTVVGLESENYTGSSDSVVFDVIRAGSSVVIHPIEDVVFDVGAYIEYDVENLTVINVTVFDAEGNMVFSVITENMSITLPILPIGHYNVSVVNVGNKNIIESSDSAEFNVANAGSSVVVHPVDDVVYGNEVLVEFEVVNRTVINVTVFDAEGNPVFSEIAEGISISIPVLAAGRYNVTVVNVGNENFTSSSDSAVFNVMKAGSSIVLHPIDDMVYGNEFDVVFDVVNRTVVNVTVFDAEGNVVFSEIADGTSITIPVLAAGKYNVTVVNAENENFTGSSDSAVFSIYKYNSTIDINPIDDQIYGNDIIVEITGENLTTINMAVYDENGREVFNQNTTEYIITLPILPVGTYLINVTNYPTDNVSGSYASRTFNIIPMNTNITITLIPESIKYDDVVTATFTLTGDDGKPIDGEIEIICNDQIEKLEVIDGKATKVFTNLPSGENVIMATYYGDRNIKGSVAIVNFDVDELDTQIIYQDMKTKAVSPLDPKTGEWFTWKLLDSNGKPMANVPMQIGFNGVVYDEKNGIVTDENGTAKLQINLGYKGDYTFAICYLGDENHRASFVVAKIVVEAQTPALTVPNKSYKATAKTKTLTATFKTAKGTAIAGKKVSFTVNGKTYSAKTNDKGVASVNVSLNTKGSYKFTAKYAGDSTYAAITKTATLILS